MTGAPYRAPTLLPRGWVVWCGQLTPDRSVAGYLARGQQVRGFCRHQQCRRTCWIDVDRLAAHHMGGLPMEEAKSLWRCHRIGGCQMDFEEDKAGLPTLGGLQALPAKVRLRCIGCDRQWEGPPAGMIARLKKRGEGDEKTLVTEVQKALRKPCDQCGRRAWDFSVMWKG
ncbi:MAG: hypothetical protein JWM33_2824 [Caulobacteraceae bacterium]|nr:hypothetical protein [Caulobacteraceae bacterium]